VLTHDQKFHAPQHQFTARATARVDAMAKGMVTAPMPVRKHVMAVYLHIQGNVVSVRVKEGATVKKGDIVAVMSAMKMETVMTAPVSGKVKKIATQVGEELKGGDVVMEIEEIVPPQTKPL